MATDNTGGVIVRRFSSDMHSVKLGDLVRCVDGMRYDGAVGAVVEFIHDGRKHPVVVALLRKDGTPSKRRARFYSWERLSSEEVTRIQRNGY